MNLHESQLFWGSRTVPGFWPIANSSLFKGRWWMIFQSMTHQIPTNPAHTCLIMSDWFSPHGVHTIPLALTAGFFWQASMGTLEPRGGWTRYCCNEYPVAIRSQIGGTDSIYKAYIVGQFFRILIGDIPPISMAQNMVRLRTFINWILEISHWNIVCRDRTDNDQHEPYKRRQTMIWWRTFKNKNDWIYPLVN